MTSSSSIGPNPPSAPKSLPTWIVAGVLGLVCGSGLTFLGLQYSGYPSEQTLAAIASATSNAPQAPGGAAGGGGGGMMGGGGGASTPRGKRNLTTLVAKLDLASKGIPFQLDQQQSSTLAEQLTLLGQSEKMTQDEAQERCDTLEAILNDGQKETLASFELPRGARGGGRGAGGGAPAGGPGGGGPPPAGGPAGGGDADDDNPFQEEANQTRLRSLLERLHATRDEGEAAN